MVRWLHNGHEIKGRTSFSLTFNHADVFSSGNYSCVPFNQVGMAQPAKTSIRIFSPPNFVQSLPPVSGKLNQPYFVTVLWKSNVTHVAHTIFKGEGYELHKWKTLICLKNCFLRALREVAPEMELFMENHGQYIKNFVIKLIYLQSCTFRHFTKRMYLEEYACHIFLRKLFLGLILLSQICFYFIDACSILVSSLSIFSISNSLLSPSWDSSFFELNNIKKINLVLI